ncbi:MAG TPA: SDR family NAD(P)-dependent oxidoreductase [Leptospiraceae bacterium]|nr:SDR family NAD(P)-dependent oxidoreductase [Leptospiraceae bacterium]HMW06576.1 SDR family NAD(P)-dependent oxidoreductase [Leptospiraceae bacterium]HMX32144.1 SDR family NAD(P)-dependent oxidoreductase [Leptospiraceae bacterium]HMY31233.1 SDR family NAD(P)-dependent oxidoreductase [Leptospiraceae bacterium]HMZ63280.1 SDR family NAD(P)-dependent oxidoreductase [Leptospiraceae bacterium]
MNKKALITGASRGIGKATAIHFAQKGYDLVLVSRNERDLKSVAEECHAIGVKVDYVVADLSEIEKTHELVSHLQSRFPDIQTLILNAGISTSVTFEDNTIENIQKELNLNYISPAFIIKSYIPKLKSLGGGNIITVSSFSAIVPFPGNSSYAATKAALYSLCTSLKIELEQYQIHVGCVLPGTTRTEMTKQFHDTPFVPFDDPSEIAQCIEDSIVKRESVVIPGILYNAAAFTYKMFPKPVDFLMSLAAKVVLPKLKK